MLRQSQEPFNKKNKFLKLPWTLSSVHSLISCNPQNLAKTQSPSLVESNFWGGRWLQAIQIKKNQLPVTNTTALCHRTAKVIKKPCKLCKTHLLARLQLLWSQSTSFLSLFFFAITFVQHKKNLPTSLEFVADYAKTTVCQLSKDGISSSHGSIPTRGGDHSMMFFPYPSTHPSPQKIYEVLIHPAEFYY